MDASVVSHVSPWLDIADYISLGWLATSGEIEQTAADAVEVTVLV